MEILGPAEAAPTKEQLIAMLSKPIGMVITSESSEAEDSDRIWLLRRDLKNNLYYRDLAYFAPALYQGLVDSTGIDGSLVPDPQGQGAYDYTQNVYRGYCRKLVAVLGTRIPNAVAVPNDPSDEDDIAAARAANNAAQYIRQHCDLQSQIMFLVYKLFNFGTSFWSLEWVVDGDANGYKLVPQTGEESHMLGGGYDCPDCGTSNDLDDPENPQPPITCAQCGGPMDDAQFRPPMPVSVPSKLPPRQIPKGALEIDIFDSTEISVPLDADGRKGISDCHWIMRECERHKSALLQKWGDVLRNPAAQESSFDYQTASFQYGESIRSAMASPIGIVRPRRENRWTQTWVDWTPRMYQMIDDQRLRKVLTENFPLGLRVTAVKGVIVDLENRKVDDYWAECQPEPTSRIMCEPLGDDWVVTQDLLNNLLNQQNETIERSNEPGFADPTRVDIDAYQRRRSEPLDLIPAIPPAGRTLADIIFRPQPPEYSEQIPGFRAQVEQTAQDVSGELPAIWGGDTSDPTARQTELKTNAAIRQLSVIWVMIGKSLEKVYEKGCRILADNEDGVLAFSRQKANEFGKFDTVAVVIEDLKGGSYHFEADEAVPLSWGQQRDLALFLLDKPASLLESMGFSDPLNIFELKELIGIPGMHIPNLDVRDKGMHVISNLLESQPQAGPPNPDGSPGPKMASIQPDWEDNGNAAFMAKHARSYLILNFELKDSNPVGYENVQLWGEALEKIANAPAPPPPAKGAVSLTLKGSDIGPDATTAVLQKDGILPPGPPVKPVLPPLKPGELPQGGQTPPGTPPIASTPSPVVQ